MVDSALAKKTQPTLDAENGAHMERQGGLITVINGIENWSNPSWLEMTQTKDGFCKHCGLC